MTEAEHLIEVIESVKKAIHEEDSAALRDLSNQTIHSASIYQDTGNLSIAILVYTLSKLIERRDYERIRNWGSFVNKIEAFFELAVASLKQNNFNGYEKYMAKARESISLIEKNIRPYIEEVMRKAAINKASRIYEHGISLGQTAKMLGITEWELLEYAGQTRISEIKYNLSYGIKKRASMAMEFFK